MIIGGREAASLLKRGIFAVNKTKEFTSAELLNSLKQRILIDLNEDDRPSTLKLGHGGTLDKEATGVLVVGVNHGCKKLGVLLQGAKNYIVVGQLGISTDTYNDEGKITNERPYSHIWEDHFKSMLKRFVGEKMQSAPLYSALKVRGRRMSDIVREASFQSDPYYIPPKTRRVMCYSAECTDFSPPFFTLHVRCGGGFYVRSLVNDLGIAVQSCAHVKQIMRTQQGPFTLGDALTENEWNLQNILDSIISSEIKFSQYEKRIHKQQLESSQSQSPLPPFL